MSALRDPIGGMLDELVEAPRGLTEDEALRFLATGVLPADLTPPGVVPDAPPETPAAPTFTPRTDGQARDLLAGRELTAAGDHWKKQPRDPGGEGGGRWVDTPGGAETPQPGEQTGKKSTDGPETEVVEPPQTPVDTSSVDQPAGRPARVDPVAAAEVLDALRSPDAFTAGHGFGGTSSDVVLEAIARRRGFDGLPKIVSKGEVDRAVESGRDELLRAVRREEHDDNFRSGPYYAGVGDQGNGIYFHHRPADFDARREAKKELYGPGAADRPDAELAAAFDDTPEMYERDLERAAKRITERFITHTRTYGQTVSRAVLRPGIEVADLARDVIPAQRDYLAKLEKAPDGLKGRDRADAELWIRAMSDPGRFAAATGIAAYHGTTPGELIVIDRGALLVQDERI